MISIYSLSDPFSGEVRYIGKTKRKLSQRLSGHLCDARCAIDKNARVNNWTRYILANNREPIIELIDSVPAEDWQFWEVYWISQFKTWGYDLCNHSKGGEEGKGSNTEESKAKRLETLKSSEKWVEGRKRQGMKLKELWRAGKFKCPYNTLSEEKKTIVRKKMINTWKETYYSDPINAKERSRKASREIIATDKLTGVEYEYSSIKQAVSCLSISKSTIIDACKGRKYPMGPFCFRYKNEELSSKYILKTKRTRRTQSMLQEQKVANRTKARDKNSKKK